MGTLGGNWCTICTLGGAGSGTRVSGVLRSGTLGGIRGAGGNCVGRTDGYEGAVSLLSGVVELKMADSYRRVCICLSPSARKGNAGAG